VATKAFAKTKTLTEMPTKTCSSAERSGNGAVRAEKGTGRRSVEREAAERELSGE